MGREEEIRKLSTEEIKAHRYLVVGIFVAAVVILFIAGIYYMDFAGGVGTYGAERAQLRSILKLLMVGLFAAFAWYIRPYMAVYRERLQGNKPSAKAKGKSKVFSAKLIVIPLVLIAVISIFTFFYHPGEESKKKATVVFSESWENGAGDWSGASGRPEITLLTADSGIPNNVQVIRTENVGGAYYSRLIPVIPGKHYGLVAKINWAGGGWPFVGIEQYDVNQNSQNAELWLIGQAGYDTGIIGEKVFPVEVKDGWGFYMKDFEMPQGTYYIRIKDELWGGASRGGESLAFFDDIQLFEVQ